MSLPFNPQGDGILKGHGDAAGDGWGAAARFNASCSSCRYCVTAAIAAAIVFGSSICFPIGYLHRYVAMLFRRPDFALGTHRLKRIDQPRPGFAGNDDGVDIAAGGSYIWI